MEGIQAITSKKETTSNLRNITIVVVAITIFLSIDPFFTWKSFAGGIGLILFKIMQMLSMLFMASHLTTRKIPISAFLGATTVIAIFIFYASFTGVKSGTTHPLIIGNFLIYLFYALCVMTDRDILLRSFELLRKIFAFFLAYTLVIYIMILIGIPVPYSILQSGEAGRVEAGYQFYHNYLGCILINQSGRLLYRFAGVFTEPGVVGTFCAFFLAADGCNLKKNKRNWIFLISGLLSFSVAFYIMFLLIYALKSLRNGGYRAFTGIMTIIVLYAIFMNINFLNSSLVELQERLTITETGLAGDNRIDEDAEKVYQAFLESDAKTVLLGYGYPDSKAKTMAWQSTTSYKESIYCLGVLGYGLMIAWFILTPINCYKSCDSRENKLMYSYMIIFILSQYQRPYMKALFLAYFLLAGSLYAQQCEKESDATEIQQ